MDFGKTPRIDVYMSAQEKAEIEAYVEAHKDTKVSCKSASWFCKQAALKEVRRGKKS